MKIDYLDLRSMIEKAFGSSSKYEHMANAYYLKGSVDYHEDNKGKLHKADCRCYLVFETKSDANKFRSYLRKNKVDVLPVDVKFIRMVELKVNTTDVDLCGLEGSKLVKVM